MPEILLYLLCIWYVFTDIDETSISKNSSPELNTNYTKDEKYKETQQQHVPKHR